MSFTCPKCRRSLPDHIGTLTGCKECQRAERSAARTLAIFVVVVVILAFTIDLAAHQYLYGDWRCAFAQCRIEVAPR